MSHPNRSIIYRLFEHIQCLVIMFIVTPGFYIFEMAVVRPKIVDTYQMGPIKNVLHIVLSTFILMNIVGNMLMSIFIDSFMEQASKSEVLCQSRDANIPEQACHCKSCGLCVVRRDHHCFFFARCIHFHNKRYYLLYLIYVTISLIYSTYYNYYYISTKFEDGDMMLAAYRIINPMLRFLIPEPMGYKDLYLLFLFVNVGLVIWTGFLLVFHMKNAVRGVSAREYQRTELYKTSKWRENLLRIFGTNWYLAVLCPYVDSPPLVIDKDN